MRDFEKPNVANPDDSVREEFTPLTAEDIKAEHEAALKTLTPEQWELFEHKKRGTGVPAGYTFAEEALTHQQWELFERMRKIDNEVHFNNDSMEVRLNRAFKNEAESRNARRRYDLGLPPPYIPTVG